MISRFLALGATLACVGCASIVNDSTHHMKVDVKSADGTFVSGAECQLTNDYGSVTVRAGGVTPVRRSDKDMDIVCKHPGQPDAFGRAISRANAGMYGNIILGGVIGAVIDHNKGTAYTYPTWITLVTGKTLVFDRDAQKEGVPVLGLEPTASK